MKKKNLVCILFLIVIGVVIFICFRKNDSEYPKEVEISEKNILIESSYSNYAWGYQYRGSAICDDGTIYSWDITENTTDFKGDEPLKVRKEWLLNNSTKSNKKISKEELEELKKCIKNVDYNMESRAGGCDMGTTSVSVWNYDQDKIIDLRISGDAVGENTSENAQKILNIVDKNLKD